MSSSIIDYQRTACFSVQARAEPAVMARVLELFAKRGLVPSRWHSTVAGPQGDGLTIDVQMAGLDPRLTAYLAACMRQIVEVECVLVSEKDAARMIRAA